MNDAMEGHAHLPRAAGTTLAIVAAAFGIVVAVEAGLALTVGYLSVLVLSVVWALVAVGLSLYLDPSGERRPGHAALWAVAAFLLGGLPIVVLAWRVATRRAGAYEPNVSR